MAILGAHMSTAGGYFRAVDRAAKSSCDCVQVFTKNNNQWRAKPLTDQECERFRDALKAHAIAAPLSHASYLINLASPDKALRQRSIDALVVEMQRAGKLGIPWVVFHPGAYVSSSEAEGLEAISSALDIVHAETGEPDAGCLLETTAGQGTNLGWQFEQLAAILDQVQDPGRLGVCVDTCHIFAAGYGLQTEAEYRSTFDDFDRLIGIERIKAFHLNDSKKPQGSRVDRHEHIGEGCLGLDAFRHLMQDERFQQIPMYLETPKDKEGDEDWDRRNLDILRSLAAS